jgi:hypothetical protein
MTDKFRVHSVERAGGRFCAELLKRSSEQSIKRV